MVNRVRPPEPPAVDDGAMLQPDPLEHRTVFLRKAVSDDGASDGVLLNCGSAGISSWRMTKNLLGGKGATQAAREGEHPHHHDECRQRSRGPAHAAHTSERVTETTEL